MLSWLLEMLACLSPSEGLDVVLRPGGDRRRECKVHVPAGERGLLGVVLDLLGGKVGGQSVSDVADTTDAQVGTRGGTGGDVNVGRVADVTDAAVLYPVEQDILAVLRREGRPLLGKVVATRCGRKYGSWIRTCLKRLESLGLVGHGREGYFLPDGGGTSPTPPTLASDVPGLRDAGDV